MGLICLGDEYDPEKMRVFFRSSTLRSFSRGVSPIFRCSAFASLHERNEQFSLFCKVRAELTQRYCEEEEEASQKSVDQ